MKTPVSRESCSTQNKYSNNQTVNTICYANSVQRNNQIILSIYSQYQDNKGLKYGTIMKVKRQ